jgi:hypothetical protein
MEVDIGYWNKSISHEQWAMSTLICVEIRSRYTQTRDRICFFVNVEFLRDIPQLTPTEEQI